MQGQRLGLQVIQTRQKMNKVGGLYVLYSLMIIKWGLFID